MVERAISDELGEELLAKTAHEKSLEKVLTDRTAFHCKDSNCAIQLTCVNFGKTGGKRFYYTPTSKEMLHHIDCSEISFKDRKEQIEREVATAKGAVKKDGTIRMTLSPNKAKSTLKVEQENKKGEIISDVKASSRKNIKTHETTNMYSVASFVDLYNSPSIDNTRPIIRIGKKLVSLEDLFLKVDEAQYTLDLHIYEGVGKISTFKKDMLKIVLNDKKKIPIFTNKSRVMRQNKDIVSKYADTDEEIQIYFRGNLGKEKTKSKFLPFNDAIYKDLYFTSVDKL
ncbi:hypothetical protein ABXM43_00090 [Enterococcus faecalis]|uniref:hypothetical protein n=1 Tax=Enterococcus faecalis TaxID=1351 RepID=UPI00115C0A1B|nr:hypothetical protein [Enterococcus faecalis]EGO5035949.1 hypothetical protein [Enterococcus faecalis]EGO7919003.1 hypothetical protein [Enterococcus faecalis]EGO8067723.1 hypothetical protein [Enterococcus faecalis]EGO8194614.1 hypothetical protein [Enterococcus faecalis]EGO8485648.1 hypothetical protein [Enterococcus faecalis]